MTSSTLLSLTAGLCGCLIASGPQPAAPATTPPAAAAPKTLEQLALDAAANYKSWTRVSDFAHWAPTNCRVPVPEGAQISESKDSDTHGRKLYFLFAKDAEAYKAIGRAPGDDRPIDKAEQARRDIGQVLVKESWTHVQIDAANVPVLDGSEGRMSRRHPPEYAFTPDGKAYRTEALAGLFIMFKVDPAKNEKTDEGWVYATISKDNTITAIGSIASCMECHTKATADRQFGPVWGRPREQAPPTAPATPNKPATPLTPPATPSK